MSGNDNIENGMIVNRKEPEDEAYCFCAWCSNPIYVGDDCYKFDDDTVCEDCISSARRCAG